MMKVKSVIDVITNSSTEVYKIYNQSSVKAIKDLLEEVLRLGGYEGSVDDFVEIKLTHADWKEIEWLLSDEWSYMPPEYLYHEEWKDLPEEELLSLLEEIQNANGYGDGPRSLLRVEVTPKKPEYKKLADLIDLRLISDTPYEVIPWCN